MTIVIIALPILVAALSLFIMFSRRGETLSENKKKIDMKMNELVEEPEKRKQNK
ncbi:MAG: hypothetical protein WC374_09500 [Phycisphaerae bacterium]|jgi:hypothetical protein